MKKLLQTQSPARLISLGFAAVILIGSALLILPCSVREGVELKYIDSLYTSTSAVCVTGLIAVDAGDTFTPVGQFFLALLIQIGGLGVTSIGAGVILAMGKKLDLKGRRLIREASNLDSNMAIRLATRLGTAKELDIIQLSEQINISKMQVPEQLVGKSVAGANLRGRFGLNIIAIESAGRVIDSIQPDYLFGSGDTLYLSGSKDGLLKIGQWAS